MEKRNSKVARQETARGKGSRRVVSNRESPAQLEPHNKRHPSISLTLDPIPIRVQTLQQLLVLQQLSSYPSSETSALLEPGTCSGSQSGSAQERQRCVLSSESPARRTRLTLECTAARDRPGKTEPPASAQSVLCSSQPPEDCCEEMNPDRLKNCAAPPS